MHTQSNPVPSDFKQMVEQFIAEPSTQKNLLTSLVLLSAHNPAIIPLLTFTLDTGTHTRLTVCGIPFTIQKTLTEKSIIEHILGAPDIRSAILTELQTELKTKMTELKFSAREAVIKKLEAEKQSILLDDLNLQQNLTALQQVESTEDSTKRKEEIKAKYASNKIKVASIDNDLSKMANCKTRDTEVDSDFLSPLTMILSARAYLLTTYPNDSNNYLISLGAYLTQEDIPSQFVNINLGTTFTENNNDLLIATIYGAYNLYEAIRKEEQAIEFNKILWNTLFSESTQNNNPNLYGALADSPLTFISLDNYLLSNLFNGFNPQRIIFFTLKEMFTLKTHAMSEDDYAQRLNDFSRIALLNYTHLTHKHDINLNSYREYVNGQNLTSFKDVFAPKCLSTNELLLAKEEVAIFKTFQGPGLLGVLLGRGGPTSKTAEETIYFVHPDPKKECHDIFTVLEKLQAKTRSREHDDLAPTTHIYRNFWRGAIQQLRDNKNATCLMPPLDEEHSTQLTYAKGFIIQSFKMKRTFYESELCSQERILDAAAKKMRKLSKGALNAEVTQTAITEKLRTQLSEAENIAAKKEEALNNIVIHLKNVTGDLQIYQKKSQGFETEVKELNQEIANLKTAGAKLSEALNNSEIAMNQLKIRMANSLQTANDKIEHLNAADIELKRLKPLLNHLKNLITLKTFNLINNEADQGEAILNLLADLGELDSKFFEEDEELTPTTSP